MSTRSSPGSVEIGSRTIRRTTYGGSVESTTLAGYNINWTDSVTFGPNVKGWRDNLRRGLSATTSMSGNKVTARFTPGHGRFVVSYSGGNPPSSYHIVEEIGDHRLNADIPSGDVTSISETKSNAEAMGKFLRKSRDAMTPFQGGVALGELAETLAMIRNPARGLRGLVTEGRNVLANIRRLGLKNSLSRSRVLSQLADAWLEVQFGWRPLLNDVKDGCTALDQWRRPQGIHTKRITASYETSLVSSNPLYGQFGDNNIAFWFVSSDYVSSCLTVYRGALRIEAHNSASMDAKLFGFSPDNFAPTIWELIPYSFLIDYFSNVGDIIEGWSQLGTRLAWCNRTVKKSIQQTLRSGSSSAYWQTRKPFVDPPILEGLTFSPAQSVIAKSIVTRGEYNSAMVPTFVFRLPGFGSLKWLNIAALVAGRNNDRKWVYGD